MQTLPRTIIRSGPQWQAIPVAARVKPKGGRRRGTVVAHVHVVGGMPQMVAVRWDAKPRWAESWPTDCLVVLDEPLPFDRFSSRQLATLILNASDGPPVPAHAGSPSPNLELIRQELRRRAGQS